MAGLDYGALVNAGQFAWTVFKDGRPETQVNGNKFSAIPKDVGFEKLGHAHNKSFRRAGGWNTETFGHVIDWEVKVDIEYGATYKGGGAYLPSIIVVPGEAHAKYALWGFSFNLNVEFGNPFNAGNDKRPIAAVKMTLHEHKSCWTESHDFSWEYEIHGDGHIRDLTYGTDLS